MTVVLPFNRDQRDSAIKSADYPKNQLVSEGISLRIHAIEGIFNSDSMDKWQAADRYDVSGRKFNHFGINELCRKFHANLSLAGRFA